MRAPGLQLAGVSQLVGRVPSRGESTKETTMPHLDITTVSAVRYSAVQCTPERCAARFRWALHRTPGPQTASPSPKRVRTAEQAPRSADFQSVTVARKSVPRPVTPARSGFEPQNRRTEETAESPKEMTPSHFDIPTVPAVRYSAVQRTPELCPTHFRWAQHQTPGPQTASPRPKAGPNRRTGTP